MKRIKRTYKLLLFLLTGLLVILISAYILLNWKTSVTTFTDKYIYDLPFAIGKKYKIVQGYGGLFSHKNTAALDFAMPEGTAVYAAREGTVYAWQDSFAEGGPSKKYEHKANYLMIKHTDGTYGCYWHLQKSGVAVKKGKVAKGQLIGYSGATGFVLRPHLHFSVKRLLNYSKEAYIQTTFKTTAGVLLLNDGEEYERPN